MKNMDAIICKDGLGKTFGGFNYIKPKINFDYLRKLTTFKKEELDFLQQAEKAGFEIDIKSISHHYSPDTFYTFSIIFKGKHLNKNTWKHKLKQKTV